METAVNGNMDHYSACVKNSSQSKANGVSRDQYYSECFEYKGGHLYCENVCVTDIKKWLQGQFQHASTPFFAYSRARLVSNVLAYLKPMQKLQRKCVLNYALKANMNPNLALLLKNLGCSATLVSGLELRMALEVGFDPDTLVLNGNGKQAWEIEQAVLAGCLLNIDSDFNLEQTAAVCRRLGRQARVLLRVNPDIDPQVHRYNTTGTSGSKFGVPPGSLQGILGSIKREPLINLVGLHCHLGSTITHIAVFRKATVVIMELFKMIKDDGFPDMEYVNLGGGLGIPYTKHELKTQLPDNGKVAEEPVTIPTPAEMVAVVDAAIEDAGVTLILEPGRSLVGDTAILVSSVIGVKHCQNKSYIVVDGAMTEVIRPALYGAYHHIDLAEASQLPGCEKAVFDVVGPVCESGDFLGKDRYLTPPHEGCCLAMFDVGAYCACMSSNYNCRARPAEVLVDQDQYMLIRKPDTYESMLMPYGTWKQGEEGTSLLLAAEKPIQPYL